MIKRDKGSVWGSCHSFSVWIVFICLVFSGQLLLVTTFLSSPYLWDYFVLLIKHALLTSQGDTLSTLLLFLIFYGGFLDQLHWHTWEKSTQRQVNKLSKAGRSCCLLSGSFGSHFAHSSYNHRHLSNLHRASVWCKINRKLHNWDYNNNNNDTLNRLDLFGKRCLDQACGNIHGELLSLIKLFYSIFYFIFYVHWLTSPPFMDKQSISVRVIKHCRNRAAFVSGHTTHSLLYNNILFLCLCLSETINKNKACGDSDPLQAALIH